MEIDPNPPIPSTYKVRGGPLDGAELDLKTIEYAEIEGKVIIPHPKFGEKAIGVYQILTGSITDRFYLKFVHMDVWGVRR